MQPAVAAAAGSNSGTRTKFVMKRCQYLILGLCAGAVLASLLPRELSAQSAATARLLELINSANLFLVEDELPRAAIDAGPPAVPAIRNILDRSTDEDRRLLALAAAVYIGGDAAVSLVRQQYTRQRDDDFNGAMAAVLASVDTPQNRRELIGMLSKNRDDWHTVQTAAFSLGILRANDAVSALQAITQPSTSSGAAAAIALRWIGKGYSAVGTTPNSEEGRVIATVLRNGSPTIAETHAVLDESNGGFWKHGPSGWIFNRGEVTDGTREGPTIKALIGAEGSRALVSLEMHCGLLCGSGYQIVLRKEGGNWKMQMIQMAWIA